VRRWIPVTLGVVLTLAGLVFTLQGLNLLGQSGGMNGQTAWAVIGPIIALAGLALIAIGARRPRAARHSPT
jgi:hypothetical protein